MSSDKPLPVAALPGEPSENVLQEFRGLWVATVNNIDWPSSAGLDEESLKAEAIAILDTARSCGFNAILFQARPACDAFYESEIEPVSSFLTGIQGYRPGDWFDPLLFWIEEAHARGLELHAWINPFRAGTPSVKSYSLLSPVVRRAAITRSVGRGGFFWLDPGLDETIDYVLSVVDDIARRYDVDGIVIDDYFYPYRDQMEEGTDFPDDDAHESWRIEALSASKTADISKAAFRRSRVDAFIRAFSRRSLAMKPWLRRGLSPFGIWKPGFPEGIAGKDSVTELYADSRSWLVAGLFDYVAPQLY